MYVFKIRQISLIDLSAECFVNACIVVSFKCYEKNKWQSEDRELEVTQLNGMFNQTNNYMLLDYKVGGSVGEKDTEPQLAPDRFIAASAA